MTLETYSPPLAFLGKFTVDKMISPFPFCCSRMMTNVVIFVIIAINTLPALCQSRKEGKLQKWNLPITVEKFIESKCTKPGEENNCEVIDKLCSNGAIIDSGCLLAYDRFCKEFSREQTTQCAKLFQGNCESCVLGKKGNDPSQVCEELFANNKDKACGNLKKASQFFKAVDSAKLGSNLIFAVLTLGLGLTILSSVASFVISLISK